MHMVGTDFHLVDRDVVGLSNLFEHLLDTRSQSIREDVFAIFRRPDQVIGRIIRGVRCPSEDHARILSTSVILRAGIEPPRKMVHPSPPQAVGH